jgi:hypothetical protein
VTDCFKAASIKIYFALSVMLHQYCAHKMICLDLLLQLKMLDQQQRQVNMIFVIVKQTLIREVAA